MRLRRTAGVAQALFAVTLLGVPPQDNRAKETELRAEIKGTVIEAGTLQPVSGATVFLFRIPAPAAIANGGAFETSVTGTRGDFRFTPKEFGIYNVGAKKDGYISTDGPWITGPGSVASASITKERPTREVQLVVARPGVVSGHVVDDETREPIADLSVLIWQTLYLDGRKRLIPASEVKTAADGAFVSKALRPGEYLARVSPRISGLDRLLKQFSKEDLEALDTDYEPAYWPGGRDLMSAFPVSVISNGSVNLGQLRLRRIPLYRVRVTLPEGSCEPPEEVMIMISNDGEALDGLGTIPCAKDFLLRGLAPGTYRLESALPERSQETRRRGSLTFQVVNKNLDLVLSLVGGVDIAGTIITAEGAVKLPVQDMKVYIRPIGGLPWADERPIAPDAEGRFRLVNTQLRDHRVSITGVPSGYYVKEVRYNGADAGKVLRLNTDAQIHSLEIVVDDKPATLTGKVTIHDKAVNAPYVVAMRWPVNSSDSLWPLTRASGDADGRFQFTGLGPGDYRFFAVSATAKEKLEEPDVLHRLLRTAQDITLAPRDFRNVTLEVTDLR